MVENKNNKINLYTDPDKDKFVNKKIGDNFPNLEDQVYKIIKDKIIWHEIKMKERIIDKKLAEELGVSRSMVRQVLTTLAKEELLIWDRVINTDLRGTFICSKNAVDIMIKNGGGSIVNIATVHTYACLPGAAPYDAAKWGIVGLTKSMAVELAGKNIRVNALSPGLINTQIWKDIQDAAEDKNACLRYWKANIPMGRVGSVREIAYLALYLASDEASYVTGSNFFIDGGMTSQLISRADFKSNVMEGRER